MLSAYWKQIAIVLIAIAGAALGIGSLAMLYPEPPGPVPSDLLPAEQTRILIEKPDQHLIRLLAQWFPETAVPKDMSNGTHALVELPTDETAWVTFESVPGEADTLSVKSDSEEAIRYLREETFPRLSNFETYSTLRDSRPARGAWAYLYDPEHSFDSSLLAEWFSLPAALSLTSATGSIQASFITEVDIPRRSIPSALPLSLPEQQFLVHAVEGLSLLGVITDRVKESVLMPLQGRLTHVFGESFGKELSTTYDLAPLLEHTVRLHLSKSTQGSMPTFLFSGTGNKEEHVATALDKLSSAYRLTLPLTETKERTFENGFTSESVSFNADGVRETEEDLNGWNVQAMRGQGSGQTFFTATNDKAFLVTTVREAMEQSIDQAEPKLMIERTEGTAYFVAAAITEREWLENVLSLLHPTPISLLPDHFTGQLLWTWEQDGKRSILTVRTVPMRKIGTP